MMINIDTSKFYVDVIHHKNEKWVEKLTVEKGEHHDESDENDAKNRQRKSYKHVVNSLMSKLEDNEEDKRINHFKFVL